MRENHEYFELAKDVIAAQNHDRRAQDRIIECVRDMVYYTCLKMLRSEDRASDATQDITVTIFKRIGTLKDPTAYIGWVRRITANYCKNVLSAKNVEFLAPRTEDEDDPFEAYASMDEETVPETVLEKSETQELIRDVIDGLPDEQRMCVLMHYFHEMKTREIADALGVSEGTVKSRLNYARKSIKTCLERYEAKGFRLCSMISVPFFGDLIHSLQLFAERGIAPALAGSGSALAGTVQRLVAGLVATVALGVGTGVAMNDSAKKRMTPPPEKAICGVASREYDGYDLSFGSCEASETSLEKSGSYADMFGDSSHRNDLAWKTAPDEPQEEIPVRKGTCPAAPVSPAVSEETAETPEETAETPEETAKTPETPEHVQEPVCEDAAEEPTVEEPEKEWSAWSMELPPEGTEIRTAIRYRRVTMRKVLSEDGQSEKPSIPTFVYTYGAWSDEPVEITTEENCCVTIETAVFYSYR